MRGNWKLKTRISLVLASIAVLIAVLGVLWQTSYWSRQYALDQIGERSRQTLSLIVEALRGDLGKYRYLTPMIASNEAFRSALKGKISPENLQLVNEELDRITKISGASDTYLMNATGLTVAASNWTSDKTFIGKNFNYRPYFQEAMEGRLGRYFALGTTSGERGYYFAYPVRDGTRSLGAIIVKIRIDHHESAWGTADQEVIVLDRNGIIFLSSNSEWLFKTASPLSPEIVTEILSSQRYGKADLSPLPYSPDSAFLSDGEFVSITSIDPQLAAHQNEFLVQEKPMVDANWRVVLLARTTHIDTLVQISLVVVTVLLLSILLAATAFYQRRRRVEERIAVQDKAKAQLELRVEERTDDLTKANLELQKEITDRKRAEAEVRTTQATLLQAAKMAALGQMSAGLSHELNQPLAAIRSYADNARAFIERNQGDTARENLTGISELTDRMARIIRNLRTYAREESVELRPTSIRTVLEGSLTLMKPRIEDEGVTVFKNLPDEDINVIAGDVRLQQIFVNLISNALDAMLHSPIKEIHIDVSLNGDEVVVTTRDTGPGITEDQIINVFDPFHSTKAVGQGMGLGLSITLGLVSQFGGTIEAGNTADGGALFTLKLKRAESAKEAVA